MHTAQRSRIVHAPTEHVWRVFDDFGGVWRYNPAVESSRIVTDIERGVGACRECVFEDGGRIEETIVDYDLDQGYTVEFTDTGPYPLVSTLVRIEIETADEHHTLVTAISEFGPKYVLLGWLLGRLVMRRQFESQFDAVLDGLAARVHTDWVSGRSPPLDPVNRHLVSRHTIYTVPSIPRSTVLEYGSNRCLTASNG